MLDEHRPSSEPPEGAEDIWSIFGQVQCFRDISFGLGAILPSEILAWQELYGYDYNPIIINAIFRLDEIYRRVQNEK